MQVSNPDRIVFPDTGYTKGDVVAHYERVALAMVPYVARRPLTLQRFPKGLSGAGFMQKNTPAHYPDTVERYEVATRDGGVTTYGIISDPQLLAYLANQGTITFHVWTSRQPHLDEPDVMIIDLDPEEGDVAKVRDLAEATRELLDSFGNMSFPVATGSKGYHVWAPLAPGHSYEDVSRCSRAIGGMLEIYNPDLATTEFLKKERGGRVFVDWLRNQPAAAVVAPYSLRPRPNAPVAVPIDWQELATTDPDAWTIETIADRLGSLPAQVDRSQLDVEGITGEAKSLGVDLVSHFDRFGRRS